MCVCVCVSARVCVWVDAHYVLVFQADCLPLFYMCVWVSECVCLSVCVKCDLGRFLKACWAVKRRCDYNFSIPLFPPQLHRYLVPATPISPSARTHNSSLQKGTDSHIRDQFTSILDQIKVRTTTAVSTQEALFLKSDSKWVLCVSSHDYISFYSYICYC